MNVKFNRGLSTSGLRVLPPTISRKAPARILACFFSLFQSVDILHALKDGVLRRTG
ncbi:hypothetical protein GY524_005322 [Escherichia coli]|nr:hypothetical protein [Escherichia coli]EFI3642918.1 hypothetical protein [Escherichia coli]EFI3681729.1 hypothetical protein [Escherichia coli]EFI3687199.1 hypothetical protein [Escherichia coli]EFI3697698.1 hypothetical protein [Escherichia coli]